MHKRQEIRDALQLLLKDHTAANSNVFTNRKSSLWESEVPAILIQTGEEQATARDVAGRQYIRSVELSVEVKASENDDVEDVLDSLAEEVEDIISVNPSISGTALKIIYKSTSPKFSSDSETDKGSLILTYEVQYIR